MRPLASLNSTAIGTQEEDIPIDLADISTPEKIGIAGVRRNN
jgi:hypothetical protein